MATPGAGIAKFNYKGCRLGMGRALEVLPIFGGDGMPRDITLVEGRGEWNCGVLQVGEQRSAILSALLSISLQMGGVRGEEEGQGW